MRQLTSLDAQFLAIEDGRTHGHVCGLVVLDPSTAPGCVLSLERLRRLFAERIHLVPPFRWRLETVPFGLGHPYWREDADTDLTYHVREVALAPPGTDRQLADLVARLTSRPLDRTRPLWEGYLIHGLPDGRVAFLFKIHHALVDGMSIAEMAVAVLDLAPEGRPVPPPEGPWGEPSPGAVRLLARSLTGAARYPWNVAAAVSRTLPHLDTLVSPRMAPGVRRTEAMARRLHAFLPIAATADADAARLPHTLVNGSVGAHRRVAFTSVPLREVKAIKNHLGGTVNDVVMAVCAGGLRTWMDKHGVLPEVPMAAMVPISTRSPEQWGTYGNRINFMRVRIPTDEPDPERRYDRARSAMWAAKRRHLKVPGTFLRDLTSLAPPVLTGQLAWLVTRLLAAAAFESPVNVIVSNVAGSPVPLYLAGARMEAQYPISVITHGVGLNLTLTSYGDQIHLGVVADRQHVTDAWEIVEAIRDALAELLALVSEPELEDAGQR